jgi:alpha-galactosidase
VPITKTIPWNKTQQWLELVARSGTPLFVSAEPSALGTEEKKRLRAAYAFAAVRQPLAEPLDWMNTPIPERWKLDGETVQFRW